MTDNSELIDWLRNYYGTYPGLRRKLDETADALEAADRRIAELEDPQDYKPLLEGALIANEMLQKENEHLQQRIAELEHEIDVQCSSEYVEMILKENERLRAVVEAAAFYMENQWEQVGDTGFDALDRALAELDKDND